MAKIPQIIKSRLKCPVSHHLLSSNSDGDFLCSVHQKSFIISVKLKRKKKCLPDANALVDSAESFKDEKAGILDKVLKASDQEEVIYQNLKNTAVLSINPHKNVNIFWKHQRYRFN